MSACITAFILHLMCYESSSAYVAMWGLMIALYQLLLTAADLSQWHFLMHSILCSFSGHASRWLCCKHVIGRTNWHDIPILVNVSADLCQLHHFFFYYYLFIALGICVLKVKKNYEKGRNDL